MRWRRRTAGAAGRDKVEFAREQRQSLTHAENLLWEALRRRALGVRFRRQHPIGDYVLDFYCGEAQLAVEIDGPTHADQQGYDDARDRWLGSTGIRVLRIPAGLVHEDLPQVLGAIRAALRGRFPSP